MARAHAQFKNEEEQMAQIFFEEQQGSLPNTHEVNLGKEHMKYYETITLRSDGELEEPNREELHAKELDELVEEENEPISLEPEERKKVVEKTISEKTLWGNEHEKLNSEKMPYILEVEEATLVLSDWKSNHCGEKA